MTVFANGLEVSAEKQGCQVIAAFPDTCFTPPEAPPTPTGVPVPYPNFGQDSDLDGGSSKVKIQDKPVSMENTSSYKKCTGDEAGAAAKKGMVTSKNTGAVYAQGWSSNVKVEDKCVVRFGDMATTNHACNTGDGGTMAFVAKIAPNSLKVDGCEAIFLKFKLHRHGDKDCPPGHESEHFVQNEYLQWDRGEVTADQFKNYSLRDAPCICMQAYKKQGRGFSKTEKIGSPHNRKTLGCNNAIRKMKSTPTLSKMIDVCTEQVAMHDPNAAGFDKEKVAECLRLAFLEYLDKAVKENDPNDSAADAIEQPIAWEVSSDPTRMWVRG